MSMTVKLFVIEFSNFMYIWVFVPCLGTEILKLVFKYSVFGSCIYFV